MYLPSLVQLRTLSYCISCDEALRVNIHSRLSLTTKLNVSILICSDVARYKTIMRSPYYFSRKERRIAHTPMTVILCRIFVGQSRALCISVARPVSVRTVLE